MSLEEFTPILPSSDISSIPLAQCMASTTENEYKPLKYMAYCLTLYAELHLDLGDCQSQGWVCHKNPAYEVFALI